MGILNWLFGENQQRSSLYDRGPLHATDLISIGNINNDAGVTVTEKTALQSSAVLACVRTISEDLAGLPFQVFRRDGRSREIAREHPTYRILHDTPNEYMTSFVFREVLQSHCLLWGNAYCFIEKDNVGNALALYPLQPCHVQPERKNGVLLYHVRTEGSTVTLTTDQVLHIPCLSFDGIKGKSVIEHAANAVGVHLASDKLAAKYFANGTHLGGYMKHPGRLTEDARRHLKSSFVNLYKGVGNAHGTPLFEEGMEYVPLTISSEEQAFLEHRKFQIEDIARLFRVSPVKIGHLERSTFNNIEHLSIDYVRSTLRSHIVRWEQEVNRKLFLESEKADYYAEMNIEGMLRGDIKTRHEAYAIGRQWGWWSINDIREFENETPVEGGDDYLQPMNMVPVGEEPQPTQGNNIDTNALIADARRRLRRKEINAIKRQWNKLKDPESFMTWAEGFYTKHRQLAQDSLQPISESVGDRIDTDDLAAEHCDDALKDLALCMFRGGWIEELIEEWEAR